MSNVSQIYQNVGILEGVEVVSRMHNKIFMLEG